MAETTKEALKEYFQTGDKPTQTEYAELIEAFRHVDDKLAITDTESLQASLDSKAAAATLLNHINDSSVHGGSSSSNLTGAEIKTAYEAESDTNAFTDIEKQQVADGVTHRADNDSHTTANDKAKWNNQLSEYTIGEVLSAEMGLVYRIYNGSLYKYTGDFPNTNTFTTSDFSTELAETPSRWMDVLSTYPPVEFAVITPKSLQPNATKWVEIDASNIKIGTTMDFGAGINVLQYNYQSSNKMLVEVQSVGSVGYSVMPKINNGTESEIQESFSISLGELHVPDSIDWPWVSKDSNLTYTLGGVENLLASGYKAGTFSNGVPIESDCSLTFSLVDVTGAQHMYFGYGNSTGSNGFSNAFFRSYAGGAVYGQNSNSSGYTMDSNLTGSTIELKRIKQTSNTCLIEIYQNGVLQDTITNISVTEVWYPYFYLLETAKIENIELLIL